MRTAMLMIAAMTPNPASAPTTRGTDEERVARRDDGRAMPPTDGPTASPHSAQNREPAGSAALQRRQRPSPRDAPHTEQNFPVTVAPHDGHLTAAALDVPICGIDDWTVVTETDRATRRRAPNRATILGYEETFPSAATQAIRTIRDLKISVIC
jgi:hypothetical protein